MGKVVVMNDATGWVISNNLMRKKILLRFSWLAGLELLHAGHVSLLLNNSLDFGYL